MAPEPNDMHNKNIENDIEINSGVTIINEEEFEENNSSGGEDNITPDEYDGYKLLQQDGEGNFHTALEGSDSDSGENEKDEGSTSFESDCDKLDGHNLPSMSTAFAVNFDIDYQDLTCTGLGDDMPSTGLGFPEIIPDDEITCNDKRDDTIEMSQDKVELVKNAMASFLLPQTNIPAWAKDISDDKWMETLEKSVHIKNTK